MHVILNLLFFDMVYSIVVPPVSVRDLQEEASGEEREPNRGLFFSGSGGPVPIQRLDFSADPTRLYSLQESESAVNLVTHPDYGVVLPVGGEYTCLAVNQFGNVTQDINVNIRGECFFVKRSRQQVFVVRCVIVLGQARVCVIAVNI